MFLSGRRETLAETLHLLSMLQIAFDLLLQGLQHPRHTNQHGNALAVDGVHDFRRLEFLLKNNGAAQQRRQVHAQELPEHMAERQQIQEPDGVHQALILQIALHPALQGSDIRQHVAVADDDSAWLRGRTRGEDDLQSILLADSRETFVP